MYNSGDKARVKSNLEVEGKFYYMENGINFDMVTTEMAKYLGQEVTINKIKYGGYVLLEDKGQFTWTDEMLEPIVESVEK